MIASRWVTVAIGLTFFLAPKVRADEGWKFPNLNPFKKSEESAPKPRRPTKGNISDDAGSGSWKFWGSKPAATNSRSNEPSTWDRMSAGTKNLVGKTKSVLTPWKSDEPAPTRPATGMNRFGGSKPAEKSFFGGAKKSKEKNTGMFDWLYSEKKGNKKDANNPQTVNEWLAQPMPD